MTREKGRRAGRPACAGRRSPGRAAMARRGDRVRDLGLCHDVVAPDRVDGHLGHAQPFSELEQGPDGHDVDQRRLAEEVDVEARGHRQRHRSDLADDDQPGRGVGQGHERRARHGAAGPAVGVTDGEAHCDGGVGDGLDDVRDRRTREAVGQEPLELFDGHGGRRGHGTQQRSDFGSLHCPVGRPVIAPETAPVAHGQPLLADSCRLWTLYRAGGIEGRAAC